jgi:1-acyl-sn-glycerol-3-phosphate acyltransferase
MRPKSSGLIASAMKLSLSPRLYLLGRGLMRLTVGQKFALKVEGLEHLPSRGPAIICPKHQRWEDIPVVGMALPPLLHYIAKVELFQRPVQREILGAWGGVPIDRQNPRATLSSFRRLLPILAQGAYVVLFPEGTYFLGSMGPGKHRLIQLLLKLQGQDGLGFLPFVPVGVAYEPRGWGYTARVRVGPPLIAPGPRLAPALTEALMARIARLSGYA